MSLPSQSVFLSLTKIYRIFLLNVYCSRREFSESYVALSFYSKCKLGPLTCNGCQCRHAVMQKRQRLLASGIYNVLLSNPIMWYCSCALPHRDGGPPVTAGGSLGPVLCCKLLTFFHHMNNTRVSMVCHTRG